MNVYFRMPTWWGALLVGLCLLVPGLSLAQLNLSTRAPQGATVQTAQVQAELVAHAPEGVGTGKTLWLGLKLVHQPHWHTYWKNPGDSGLPTRLEWTLPAGLMAGDIAWPRPQRIPLGNLVNFGYEGTVLLPVPINIGPDFQPPPSGDLDIKLFASWLVCREECIPEEGQFTLRLPTRGSTAAHGPLFQASWQAQPTVLNGTSQAQLKDQSLELRISGLPSATQGQTLTLFPELPEVLHTAGELGRDWQQAWEGPVWTARLPLSAQRSTTPDTLPLVLAVGGQAWQVHATVQGHWPPTQAPAEVPAALQAALDQARQPSPPPATAAMGARMWLVTVLGAFLGGLILNLMPCVFPVLALKVFAFAQHTQAPRLRIATGLAYTAGVVLSFMALGGLLLGLRATGEAIGWGFQLQSPAVVAGLALLFTVIGLNLAGVFELGQVLPSGLASLQLRHPASDAALSGVLAVAVASPCTAPFMGASMGVAVTLPTAQALGLFAVLGVGMALPYLAASAWPGLAARLPRPGAWMDTLRRALAFPMWGTVVWLVWVLGQQTGIDGAASLLVLLLAVAMLLWSLSLTGRSRWAWGSLSGGALVLLAWAWGGLIIQTPQEEPSSHRASAATVTTWQTWSTAAVQNTLASGQPVFVDFTAAWCVTCQYNKQTTLADTGVLQAFAAKRVHLLRADWTRRDPAITAALAQLGRNGVPVYVLYAPGRPPVVLSEVLSKQEVQTALAAL